MKLWEKGIATEAAIEAFTVGNDRDYDRDLAKYDIKASAAHAKMLARCKFITDSELDTLLLGLDLLAEKVSEPDFEIEEQFEDIHSYIEFFLTQTYGEVGKKIHTARSRNDQVLTAIQLYTTDQLNLLIDRTASFAELLLTLADQYKEVLMP